MKTISQPVINFKSITFQDLAKNWEHQPNLNQLVKTLVHTIKNQSSPDSFLICNRVKQNRETYNPTDKETLGTNLNVIPYNLRKLKIKQMEQSITSQDTTMKNPKIYTSTTSQTNLIYQTVGFLTRPIFGESKAISEHFKTWKQISWNFEKWRDPVWVNKECWYWEVGPEKILLLLLKNLKHFRAFTTKYCEQLK